MGVLTTGSEFAIELSPQQIASCSPATGDYGCQGCNGGFTEGAYEYLKTVAGLANSFYIPYQQSLTETTDTVACMTSQVEAIDGPNQMLSGGYAAVSGYTYATPACTGTSLCKNQDLRSMRIYGRVRAGPLRHGNWFQHHCVDSLLDCEEFMGGHLGRGGLHLLGDGREHLRSCRRRDHPHRGIRW